MTSTTSSDRVQHREVHMTTLRHLSKELDLHDHEALAVARLAGVAVRQPTDPITAGEEQLIRDVLAGKVVPAKSRTRPQVPRGRLAAVALLVLGAIIGIAALGAFLNKPAGVYVRAGDCFNEPAIFGTEIKPVSCSGRHKYRSFARLDLDLQLGEAYPGEDTLEAHMRERCVALHPTQGRTSDNFTGLQEIHYFYPKEVYWDRGAVAGLCAVRD